MKERCRLREAVLRTVEDMGVLREPHFLVVGSNPGMELCECD